MQPRTLLHSESQRAEPVALRDHTLRPYLRERAATVLRIADGTSPHAVVRYGLLRERAPNTVYDLINRDARPGSPRAPPPARASRFFASRGEATRGHGAPNA